MLHMSSFLHSRKPILILLFIFFIIGFSLRREEKLPLEALHDYGGEHQFPSNWQVDRGEVISKVTTDRGEQIFFSEGTIEKISKNNDFFNVNAQSKTGQSAIFKIDTKSSRFCVFNLDEISKTLTETPLTFEQFGAFIKKNNKYSATFYSKEDLTIKKICIVPVLGFFFYETN